MVTGIEIRSERPEDFERIFDIEEEAFGGQGTGELVKILRSSSHPFVSLVASINGELVGHISFSPVTFEASAKSLGAAQLSPIAVLPRHQRRGIGQALIQRGLDECVKAGWSVAFLVGDPRYYSRFGFEMAGERGLTIDGPHGEYLQVLELEPGALEGIHGRIFFHPAFAALDGH